MSPSVTHWLSTARICVTVGELPSHVNVECERIWVHNKQPHKQIGEMDLFTASIKHFKNTRSVRIYHANNRSVNAKRKCADVLDGVSNRRRLHVHHIDADQIQLSFMYNGYQLYEMCPLGDPSKNSTSWRRLDDVMHWSRRRRAPTSCRRRSVNSPRRRHDVVQDVCIRRPYDVDCWRL